MGKFAKFVVQRLTVVRNREQAESPLDYNLPYEEVNFYSRDGIKLRGWLLPAPGSQATIIFAHGYPRSKADGLLFSWWLWQAGYSLLLFDFRGHGASDGPRGTSIGIMERLDILGAVDYLARRGESRMALFGISMGASASIMAAGDSHYVKAVIADSPYAYLYRPIATQVSARYRAPRWLAQRVARQAVNVVAAYHGFRPEQANTVDFIAKISPRPLLLMHGEADSMTEVENSHLLYSLAGDPKQLWIMPGVEHAQLYKTDPYQYQQKVLEFLRQVAWDAPLTSPWATTQPLPNNFAQPLVPSLKVIPGLKESRGSTI